MESNQAEHRPPSNGAEGDETPFWVNMPDRVWPRRLAIASAVLLVLAIAGRVAYRPAKHWQARKLAARAEQQIRQGDSTAAHVLLKSAIQMALDEPAVIRAMAHYSSKAGLPDALDYWTKLLATASATDSDRLEAAEAALKVERVDTALGILREMVRRMPENQNVLRLLVRAHAALEDYGPAILASRQILALEPDNDRDKTDLGELLLTSTNRFEWDEGKRLLWGVALSQSPINVKAASLLGRTSDLKDDEARLLVRRLESASQPSITERVVGAQLKSRLDPSSSAGAFSNIFQSFDSAAWADRIQMAQWAAERSPSTLAGFLTPERVSTNRILLRLKAESLANAKQWEALDALLSQSSTASELGEPQWEWLRAQLAWGKGRTDDARKHVRAAIGSATGSPRMSAVIARSADSMGFAPEAILGWEAAMNSPAIILEASREILRLAQFSSDLVAVQRTFKRLNEYLPGNPSLQGELATLDALLNQDVASASERLTKLRQAQPDNTAWRNGLALARFRLGDSSGALALMEEKSFDWAASDPRGQAIYVAVLGGNGQREAARRFARMISIEKLRQGERQLVDPWR